MAVTMNVILVAEKIDFDSFYNKPDIGLAKFLTLPKLTCFCPWIPGDGIQRALKQNSPQ